MKYAGFNQGSTMARGKKKASADAELGAGKKQDTGLASFMSEFSGSIVDKDDDAKKSGEANISTSSLAVDLALGGGLRRGYISELYGAPYGGKTTLALGAVKTVLRSGGRVLFIDTEGALDIGIKDPNFNASDTQKSNQSWLRKNGVDPFDANFVLARPDTGQEIYQMVYRGVTQRLFDLIVLDSMAGIVTAKEKLDVQDGKFDAANFGAVAKLNASSLKVIVKELRKTGFTHFCIINQQRDVVNSMGPGGKKSTGGNALEHYVRQRARINRFAKNLEAFAGSTEKISKAYFKLEKSSFGTPCEVEFQISSERGIDTPHEVLKFAINQGYVGVSGAWHYFYDRPVDFSTLQKAEAHKDSDEGFLGSVQGAGQAKLWLLDKQELFEKLFNDARQTIIPEVGEN